MTRGRWPATASWSSGVDSLGLALTGSVVTVSPLRVLGLKSSVYCTATFGSVDT